MCYKLRVPLCFYFVYLGFFVSKYTKLILNHVDTIHTVTGILCKSRIIKHIMIIVYTQWLVLCVISRYYHNMLDDPGFAQSTSDCVYYYHNMLDDPDFTQSTSDCVYYYHNMFDEPCFTHSTSDCGILLS
jgi:hypothetical protein